MNLEIYSIFDSKAKAFLPPLHFQNHYVAVRAFTDACNDPASSIYKHPGDYTLFHVGDFDDSDAVISPRVPAVNYGLGSMYKDPVHSVVP